MEQLRNIATAMTKDPKYQPYLNSIQEYLQKGEKGSIGFGASVGGQKPPTVPVEDMRNIPTITDIQNQLFKAMQGMGQPNFSAMMNR